MKIHFGIVSICLFIPGCAEESEPIFYDYVWDVPEFMIEFPNGTDDGPGSWIWDAKDNRICVVQSRVWLPKAALKSPAALKKAAAEANAHFELNAELSNEDPTRYIHEQKTDVVWKYAVAEQMPDGRCAVALFKIVRRDSPLALPSAEAGAVLAALKNGRFGKWGEFFLSGRSEWLRNEMQRSTGSRLVVVLLKSGELLFENREISLAEVTDLSRAKVKTDRAAEWRPRLHLRIEKDCRPENVRVVVEAAAEGGLQNVVFGSFATEAEPTEGAVESKKEISR